MTVFLLLLVREKGCLLQAYEKNFQKNLANMKFWFILEA